MELNPIILSIPVYFILIAIEWIVSVAKLKNWYRINDTIGNIGCGITEQITGVFIKVLIIAAYTYIHEHYRIFDIPHTWYRALVLFIAVDFLYYWAHRMSHEINLFWTGHVVHHQSEEYNLSVALRQGTFQKLFTMPFFWPLALLGFDPYWFLFVGAFTTLYQFWIHTEGIEKLGWFEYIFNTPSHHRVHHGRDPEYIDKNHAGTFIIWDRMFGTFQEEKHRPHYGITKPVQTFNPIKATLIPFADLVEDIKPVPGMLNKIQAVFRNPGWWKTTHSSPSQPDFSKFDVPVPKKTAIYGLIQFVLIIAMTAMFLFNFQKTDMLWRAVITAYLLFSLYSIGNLLDRAKNANSLETTRLIGFIAVTLGLLVFSDVTFPKELEILINLLNGIYFLSLLYLIKETFSSDRKSKTV